MRRPLPESGPSSDLDRSPRTECVWPEVVQCFDVNDVCSFHFCHYKQFLCFLTDDDDGNGV